LVVEIPQDLSAVLVVDRIPQVRLAVLVVEIPPDLSAAWDADPIPLDLSAASADAATASVCCANRHRKGGVSPVSKACAIKLGAAAV
jgi:hypothetical protein